MKRQGLGARDAIGPDRADDLQPGRQQAKMFTDERSYCFSVIRSPELALVQAVDQDDALAWSQRSLTLERLQWIDDPLNERSVGIWRAGADREPRADSVVRHDELVVRLHRRGLGHLGRHGVHKLRYRTEIKIRSVIYLSLMNNTKGSGCGSVGIVSRGRRFESNHRQNLHWTLTVQWIEKTKIKKKRDRNGPFYKK